jgi:hypothetical protein
MTIPEIDLWYRSLKQVCILNIVCWVIWNYKKRQIDVVLKYILWKEDMKAFYKIHIWKRCVCDSEIWNQPHILVNHIVQCNLQKHWRFLWLGLHRFVFSYSFKLLNIQYLIYKLVLMTCTKGQFQVFGRGIINRHFVC